jgi:lipid-binding SYLF domain-containing protein
VIKGAIGIGGRWGKGVMMVRTEKGWSDPSFISFGGASIGWQWGGEATDFVLIFRTRQSIEGVTSGKFTIGPNASAAAGPVGRSAEASTDAQLKAAILTYARSRGLFAGVSLEGSSLSIDDDANIEYYGTKRISARAIFDGEITNKPPSAAKLVEAVTNATTGKGTKPGG